MPLLFSHWQRYWQVPICSCSWERVKAKGEGASKDMVGGIIDSMNMSLSTHWELTKDREAWLAVFHGIPKSWTQLSDFPMIRMKKTGYMKIEG